MKELRRHERSKIMNQKKNPPPPALAFLWMTQKIWQKYTYMILIEKNKIVTSIIFF